nr:hypothetical protein BgiMline_025303 [Biomphalaria glabrata]
MTCHLVRNVTQAGHGQQRPAHCGRAIKTRIRHVESTWSSTTLKLVLGRLDPTMLPEKDELQGERVMSTCLFLFRHNFDASHIAFQKKKPIQSPVATVN